MSRNFGEGDGGDADEVRVLTVDESFASCGAA
jgi:hypothetical protein